MRPVPAVLQALRDRTAAQPDKTTVAALVAAERAHTDSYKETAE